MASITGFKDIDRKLRKLEGSTILRILRKTLRLALQPWLARTRAAAPKRTGKLARLLRITAGRAKRGRITSYISLAGRKSKQKAKAAKGKAPASEQPKDKFYGSFVEAGTREVDGREFMKAKFLEMKGKILRTVGDILWIEIEQEMKK